MHHHHPFPERNTLLPVKNRIRRFCEDFLRSFGALSYSRKSAESRYPARSIGTPHFVPRQRRGVADGGRDSATVGDRKAWRIAATTRLADEKSRWIRLLRRL